MLILSRENIIRRGINVPSQKYGNLVTFWEDTESSSSLCPIPAVPCAVCVQHALPPRVGWISVVKKKDITELWLLLNTPKSYYIFLSMLLLLDPWLKSILTPWTPRIKRRLNVANCLCFLVLNWVTIPMSTVQSTCNLVLYIWYIWSKLSNFWDSSIPSTEALYFIKMFPTLARHSIYSSF